jgi:hypothetical protein
MLRLDGRPATSFTGYPVVEDVYAGLYAPIEGEGAAGYQLSRVVGEPAVAPLPGGPVCFANGLCAMAAAYDGAAGRLELVWEVSRPLTLPEIALISNPPPPGVYAGPRLLVFGQLLDGEGGFLAGDDGLWVDPAGLQPGDRFVQQHHLVAPAGSEPARVAFGLYDPMTGERILAEEGQAVMVVPLERAP